MCVWAHMHHDMNVEIKGHLGKVSSPLHRMDPRDWTPVLRLGSEPIPAQPSCHSPLPDFYLHYNLGFEPSHHLIKFFSVWEWLLFQVGLSYFALGQGNLFHLKPQSRLSELAPSYWWLASRMEEKLLYFPTCISLLVFVCLFSNVSVLILKWNPWFSSLCWIVSHVRVFRISCINSSVLSLIHLVYYLDPEFIQLLCRKVLFLPEMQHKQK